MNRHVLILLFSLYTDAIATNNLFYTEQENVCDCVVKVVEYMSNVEDIAIIGNNATDELSALYKLNGTRFIARTFIWNKIALNADTYIIMLQSYDEFKNGIKLAKIDFFWNPRAKFIIVIENLSDQLRSMSKLLLENNIFNVFLITKAYNEYVIYTFRPDFRPCIKFETLVMLASCSKYAKEMNADLAANKFSLRGCRFKFLARNNWPFMDFQNSTGIECFVIKTFEEYQGLRITVEKLDQQLNGDLYDKMEKSEAEGLFGGYCLVTEYVKKFSFSYPVLIDHLLIVTRRSFYMTSWHALCYKAFHYLMLLFVFFLVFAFVVTHFSIFPKRNRDVMRDCLIVFGYFLNKVSIRNTNSGIPQRIFFSCMLFLVLLCPYIIQAYLVSVETHPVRVHELHDANEIYEKCELVMSSTDPNVFYASKTPSEDCGSELNCLYAVRASKSRSLYTLISNAHFETYKWMITDALCQPKLHQIKDPYVNILRTVYFRRGSVLLEPINKFFLRFMSAGFMSKKDDNSLKFMAECKKHYLKHENAKNMLDLKDAFIILLVGYFVSTVVFVVERKYKRR